MTDRSAFDTFSDRLDAYGADLARWPQAWVDEAQALIARSPEARARHAESRRLDALVAEAARAETPNGFAFRVVAEVAARRRDRFAWLQDQFAWATGSPGRFGLAGATFCAAALGVGLVLGAMVGPGGGMAQHLDFGVAVEMSLLEGDL